MNNKSKHPLHISTKKKSKHSPILILVKDVEHFLDFLLVTRPRLFQLTKFEIKIYENLLAIIVTNSSNSMAPLLSASTCTGVYGKCDNVLVDDDEDDDEKEDGRDGDDFNLVDHVLQLLV